MDKPERPKFTEYQVREYKPLGPSAGINSVRWGYDTKEVDAYLDRLFEGAVRVYGIPGMFWAEGIPQENLRNDDTHQAYLAFIEELPKKECAHEPVALRMHFEESVKLAPGLVGFNFFDGWKCKHCGKKLKAKWEAVE